MVKGEEDGGDQQIVERMSVISSEVLACLLAYISHFGALVIHRVLQAVPAFVSAA